MNEIIISLEQADVVRVNFEVKVKGFVFQPRFDAQPKQAASDVRRPMAQPKEKGKWNRK